MGLQAFFTILITFLYGNEHLHNEHKNNSHLALTIRSAKETKKVITKR